MCWIDKQKKHRLASERWRRKQGIKPRIQPIKSRLLKNRLITEGGCWLWKGKCNRSGYAMTTTGSRSLRKYVHRISYCLFVGIIPEGKELDHICRNRNCFNPEHLEAVTRSENTKRGIGPILLSQINGSKIQCKYGHPFNAKNTRFRPNGGRACRVCDRINQAKYRKLRKQEINNVQD